MRLDKPKYTFSIPAGSRATKRTKRWYDTADVAGSVQAGKQHELELFAPRDLGDQYEVCLFGTVENHEQFMVAEGYDNQSWTREIKGEQYANRS